MASIRSRWQVMAAALCVFVLGFLAGAFSLHLFLAHHRPPPDQRGPAIVRIIDSLNLTPEQKTQVEVIFSDIKSQLKDVRKETQPRVDDIRSKGRARLQVVLTPDQWKELEDREKAEAAKQGGPPH
jgi:Spy/CpxP family protein refolding chaperone